MKLSHKLTIGLAVWSAFFLFLYPLKAEAYANKRAERLDSISRQLPKATTAADSISIYYDLLDLSTVTRQPQYARELIRLGLATGADSVVLDVLRLCMSDITRADSSFNKAMKIINSLPESDDRSETEVFLRLNRISREAKTKPRDERIAIFHSLTDDQSAGLAPTGDIFKQVYNLYERCIWLGLSETNGLSMEYMYRLKDLLKKLPESRSNALNNMFFTQMAVMATSYEQQDQAIAADSTLLDIMDKLKRRYNARGRRFRDFSRYEYVSRARMLANYEKLTPEQVEYNYSRILANALENPDVKRDLNTTERAVAFYLMASGDYPKALRVLQRHPEMAESSIYARAYFSALTEAAEAIGDKATLIDALRRHNDMLRDQLHNQTDTRYNQLRLLSKVSTLHNVNEDLQREIDDLNIKWSRRTYITLGLIAVLLMVAGGVVAMTVYRLRQARHSASVAEQKVADADTEIESMKSELGVAHNRAEKVDDLIANFLRNIHSAVIDPLNDIAGYSQLITDTMNEEQRSRMEPFAKLISENNLLVEHFINDLLDTSRLESDTMSVNVRQINLTNLCREVYESVKEKATPDVKVEFKAPDDPCVLVTDPTRLRRILENLMDNALKFTERGRVLLSYRFDPVNRRVNISVTDTGPGIPADAREKIFERFVKLNSTTQGAGLGLYVVRLTARLLNGTVRLDPTYTHGARFVVVLQVKNNQ